MNSFITSTLDKEETIPSDTPLRKAIGKTLFPNLLASHHTTAALMKDWGLNVCPVNCGKDWIKGEIIAFLLRGPHRFISYPDIIASLHDETKEQVKKGYARVVKREDIKNKILPKLKISSVAMGLHKSRKFHTILDVSFSLKHKRQAIQSVNDTTLRQAHVEFMVQMGQYIQCIITTMVNHYKPTKPFSFSKINIKDGFWCMIVSQADTWNFLLRHAIHLTNNIH